jgi:hypothetical protein
MSAHGLFVFPSEWFRGPKGGSWLVADAGQDISFFRDQVICVIFDFINFSNCL